jgi:hypothetical protein
MHIVLCRLMDAVRGINNLTTEREREVGTGEGVCSEGH